MEAGLALSQSPTHRKGRGLCCFSQRLMGLGLEVLGLAGDGTNAYPLAGTQSPPTNTQKALCWIPTSCPTPTHESFGEACWL